MSEPLTRVGLDLMLSGGCGVPGCKESHHLDALFFHGRCHPKSPTWVKYEKSGVLTISCAQCRRTIAEIMVAGALE